MPDAPVQDRLPQPRRGIDAPADGCRDVPGGDHELAVGPPVLGHVDQERDPVVGRPGGVPSTAGAGALRGQEATAKWLTTWPTV
ncbi:hypothetical protein ACVGVM_20085 [Pseudonocardia bannensis]|uniref:Uncharacterized protein n=1 Tax=Pseudonocardia bannensis TaxID=630973 RepID=A0A848DF54_9PSEU|nr:hypothetical protein [Pseudonocardia bannensis]NMH91247.1 hypothetical protein [Pseudonocardia bannensis]